MVASVGAFCIPLYIPYALTGIWHFGRGMCKLWLLIDYLMCTASVFNIVIISYDRFLSVTKAVSTLFIAFLSFVARCGIWQVYILILVLCILPYW